MIARLAIRTGIPPRDLLEESPEMVATLVDVARERR